MNALVQTQQRRPVATAKAAVSSLEPSQYLTFVPAGRALDSWKFMRF